MATESWVFGRGTRGGYASPRVKPRTISGILVWQNADRAEQYQVGFGGVTEIILTTKNGSSAEIPYLQVWEGEQLVFEVCQHNVLGTYYKRSED